MGIMGAGQGWVARLRAGFGFGSLGLIALAAFGCGDDEGGGPPVDMMMGQCVSGTVRTCVDRVQSCSGRQLCTNSMFGPCMCSDVPLTDASQPEPDGSVIGNDASVLPDASQPEPDAGRDSGPGPSDVCDDGASCIPEPPADFEGPFLTFIGGSSPPSCGGAYADEGPSGRAGLIAPPADCSTCSCESTANSCATYVDVEAGGNASCGGASCSVAFSQACGAPAWPCIDGDATANVRAKVPAGAGACTPSAQEPDIEPPSFAQRAHSCAPATPLAASGCDGDRVCAPSGPFDGSYCVTRDGAHDCPDGAYSERHVFYGDVEDNRDCSACECDRDCDYTVELFPEADTTCAGTPSATLSIASPNASQQASSCEDAPVGDPNTLRAAFTVSGTGSCDPSGGEPEGAATGIDPVTFCCLP